jgi:hypothetical protein
VLTFQDGLRRAWGWLSAVTAALALPYIQHVLAYIQHVLDVAPRMFSGVLDGPLGYLASLAMLASGKIRERLVIQQVHFGLRRAVQARLPGRRRPLSRPGA